MSFNDPLNLRTFIESVNNHISENVPRERGKPDLAPRTILAFLSALLKNIPLKELDTPIILIQKVFSGNVDYRRLDPLNKAVQSKELETSFLANLGMIAESIYSVTHSDAFFRSVLEDVSLRFFEQQEKAELELLLQNKSYDHFLLIIVRHGFSTLYNLPVFFGERMYNEAATCFHNSHKRYGLLKAAGDAGHSLAALEYGNFLSQSNQKDDLDSAFAYLMKALPSESAIWNLCYMIENHQVECDQLRVFVDTVNIDQRLKDERFAEHRDELDSLFVSEKDPEYASEIEAIYKIHWYLALSGFSKSYNSLYKLVIQGKLSVKDSSRFTVTELKDRYLRKSVIAGELTAIGNTASALLKEYQVAKPGDFSLQKEEYMLELMNTACQMGDSRAYYNLGVYYTNRLQNDPHAPVTREMIEAAYDKAVALDIGNGVYGHLYLNLARITKDRDKKILYFTKALDEKRYDAAYELAQLYFLSGGENPYSLIHASSLLKENRLFMTTEYRKSADTLLGVINQIMLAKE